MSLRACKFRRSPSAILSTFASISRMPAGLLDPLLLDALDDVEELDLKNYSPNGWQDWLTNFNLYMERISFNKFPDGMKKFALLKKLGHDGLAIYNVLNGPKPITYDGLLALFNDYFIPSNTRYIFLTLKQRDDEPFMDFAEKLVAFSHACRFQSFQDVMVRDVFIANMHEKHVTIRDQLRRLGDPSLKQAVARAEALQMKGTISIPLKSDCSVKNPDPLGAFVVSSFGSIAQKINASRPQSVCGFDDHLSETARNKAKYALPNIYTRDVHDVEVVQISEKGAFVWLCSHHRKRQEFFAELNTIYNSAPTPPIHPKHVGQYVVLDEGIWYRVDVMNIDEDLEEALVVFLDHGYCKYIPFRNFRKMNTRLVEVEPLALRVTFVDEMQRNFCLEQKQLKIMFMQTNPDRSWLVKVLTAPSEAASREPSVDSWDSGKQVAPFETKRQNGWQNRGYQSDDQGRDRMNGRALMEHCLGNSGLNRGGPPTKKELEKKDDTRGRGGKQKANGKRGSSRDSNGSGGAGSVDNKNTSGELRNKKRSSSGLRASQNRRDTNNHRDTNNPHDATNRRSHDTLGLKPLMESLPDGYEPNIKTTVSNNRSEPTKRSASANEDSSNSPLPPLSTKEFTPVIVAQVAGGKTYVVPMLGDMSKRHVLRPMVGMICAALYEGDWYRGVVLAVDPDKHAAKISYIDFGNVSTLKNSELRTVPKHLMTKSVMQYPIRIKGGGALQPDEKASIRPLYKDEDGVWVVEMEDSVKDAVRDAKRDAGKDAGNDAKKDAGEDVIEEPRFLRNGQRPDQGSSRYPIDVMTQPIRRPNPPPIPHDEYTDITI
ncbi:unnamed protein product, partial [Nesidiocoris tenuis]